MLFEPPLTDSTESSSELALLEAMSPVHDDEIRCIGLVAVRELIEFGLPINEPVHTVRTIRSKLEVWFRKSRL